MDVKSGRPVDIRTLGGGWPNLFNAFTEKSSKAKALYEKWAKENPRDVDRFKKSDSKI